MANISIQAPLAKVRSEATNTAAKNRPRTSRINTRRCGGAKLAMDGRKKNCAKTMPPTQMTTHSK